MPAESVALFISLYIDEDTTYRSLPGLLRAQGYDVVSSLELGQVGKVWDDEKQLTYAAENKRAILTGNATDFEPLAVKWERIGREHYGILIAKQLGIGEVLRRLLRLLDSVTAGEMKGTFRYL